MKYTVRGRKRTIVKIDQKSNFSGNEEVILGRKKYIVSVNEIGEDGRIKSVSINNKVYPVEIEKRNDGLPTKVVLNSIPYDLEIERVESTRYRIPSKKKTISGEVKSSLPGQIIAILVEKGMSIKKGQTLLILESMKMENEINSPKSGIVKQVFVKSGDSVMKGHLLVEIQ
jgi:glutaconyl-CoA/methylmalonyl-CoA decarboxylase subunit gamma